MARTADHNIIDYLTSDRADCSLDDSLPETVEYAALGLFFKPEGSLYLNNQGGEQSKLTLTPQNKFKERTILFIPANGIGKVNDFSIFRLAQELKELGFSCVILTRAPVNEQFSHLFDKIYHVTCAQHFFDTLCHIPYSKILYRGWMHAYGFGAFLTQHFRNVVLNIKDWNFSTEEEYIFLFGTKSSFDFKAIAYSFQHAEKVVSHYTEEEHRLWADEYNVSQDTFYFLPEYCHQSVFHTKSNNLSDCPHIVHAGTLPPASYPEDFFWTKGYLRTIKKLSCKNILFSCVIPESYYQRILNEKALYSDIMYEDRFNTSFTLRKGKDLDPSILDQYHFGHFTVEYTTRHRRLNRYAVPSKVAFYLEAGLPLMVNERMESVAHLVKKHNLGVVYSNDDLEHLDEILIRALADYPQLLENITRFREIFCYSHKELRDIFDTNR